MECLSMCARKCVFLLKWKGAIFSVHESYHADREVHEFLTEWPYHGWQVYLLTYEESLRRPNSRTFVYTYTDVYLCLGLL